MKVSDCCSAPFLYPGHPDSDVCSSCYEHADVFENDEEKIDELN